MFSSLQYYPDRTSHRYCPSSTNRTSRSRSLALSQARISLILSKTNKARRRSSLGAAIGNAPMVRVNAAVKDGNVQLEVDANRPFEYTTYRPSASLYVIDLSGVAAADPVGVHLVASNLVKSYRVISFAAGDKPEVRVEILLKEGVEPRLQRKGNQNLTLLVSSAENGSS